MTSFIFKSEVFLFWFLLISFSLVCSFWFWTSSFLSSFIFRCFFLLLNSGTFTLCLFICLKWRLSNGRGVGILKVRSWSLVCSLWFRTLSFLSSYFARNSLFLLIPSDLHSPLKDVSYEGSITSFCKEYNYWVLTDSAKGRRPKAEPS